MQSNLLVQCKLTMPLKKQLKECGKREAQAEQVKGGSGDESKEGQDAEEGDRGEDSSCKVGEGEWTGLGEERSDDQGGLKGSHN